MDQTGSPLQRATELLERARGLIQTTAANNAERVTTAARVRAMTTAHLRQDPVLWAAYTRGWEDRTAAFDRAARSARAPPAHHGRQPATTPPSRSRSPRRPPGTTTVVRKTSLLREMSDRPVAIPPPPPTPTPRRPAGIHTVQHPPTTEWTGMPQPHGWWEQTYPTAGLGPLDRLPPPSPSPPSPPSPPPPTTSAPATLTNRQRRNRLRMAKYLEEKKATTQQFRLAKNPTTQPHTTTTPPNTHLQGPREPLGTEDPTPEEENPSGMVESSENQNNPLDLQEDMEISPEEEERVLEPTPLDLADLELEASFYTASPPTSPRH